MSKRLKASHFGGALTAGFTCFLVSALSILRIVLEGRYSTENMIIVFLVVVPMFILIYGVTFIGIYIGLGKKE